MLIAAAREPIAAYRQLKSQLALLAHSESARVQSSVLSGCSAPMSCLCTASTPSSRGPLLLLVQRERVVADGGEYRRDAEGWARRSYVAARFPLLHLADSGSSPENTYAVSRMPRRRKKRSENRYQRYAIRTCASLKSAM